MKRVKVLKLTDLPAYRFPPGEFEVEAHVAEQLLARGALEVGVDSPPDEPAPRKRGRPRKQVDTATQPDTETPEG